MIMKLKRFFANKPIDRLVIHKTQSPISEIIICNVISITFTFLLIRLSLFLYQIVIKRDITEVTTCGEFRGE